MRQCGPLETAFLKYKTLGKQRSIDVTDTQRSIDVTDTQSHTHSHTHSVAVISAEAPRFAAFKNGRSRGGGEGGAVNIVVSAER